MNKPQLEYPLDNTPAPGALKKIADGVFWIRMPMPGPLDHINLWLLEDVNGWVAVDSGLATNDTIASWSQVWKNLPNQKPISRQIVTHMHPDHIGLAGWICRRTGAEFLASRGEYLTCKVLVQDTNQAPPDVAIKFCKAAGYDEEQLDIYRARFGSFGNMIRGLPDAYTRLHEGDSLSINSRQWRVIIGEGHSPEHVCLYCEELGLFISGDQLLPTISSNISVWPLEPKANPLQSWLDSCRKLQRELPESTLVLPAHGLPFKGAHQRLQHLIDGHERGVEAVFNACNEPMRAVDFFSTLFRRKIDSNNYSMAIGESMANLNYLVNQGRLTSELDSRGVRWYRQA